MTDAPPPAPSGTAAAPEPAGPAPGGTVRGGTVRGGGRRRRRTRWRAAFLALAGLVIVAGTGWALLGNRLLVVRSVSVTGTHLLAPAQVIAAADIPLGTPLLRVDAGSVANRVEAIPQVASATVTKDWPDHLVISVTERVPVMAVRMASGGYDLVDQAGVIVRWAQARPAALPQLETSLTGAALRGSAEVAVAADVLAELDPWLARQVMAVQAAPVAEGTEQVTLDLRDGKTVQWGSPGDAAEKNREVAILLPRAAHQVDVSAPGTVVTRLPRRVTVPRHRAVLPDRPVGPRRHASRHARGQPRGELTTMPHHPTVPINRREAKTLNLNLKVKLDVLLSCGSAIPDGVGRGQLAANSVRLSGQCGRQSRTGGPGVRRQPTGSGPGTAPRRPTGQ